MVVYRRNTAWNRERNLKHKKYSKKLQIETKAQKKLKNSQIVKKPHLVLCNSHIANPYLLDHRKLIMAPGPHV